MPFVTIPSSSILVGEPVTADLFTNIKNNFDNHEARILANETGIAKLDLINQKVYIGANSVSQLTGFHDIDILQNCIVTEVSIQIYEKAPATSGSITLDVKKNTTTNPAGFNSIMTILPTINVAVASNYARNVGTINSVQQSLLLGDILRIDITSLPVGLQYFRVTVVGEI